MPEPGNGGGKGGSAAEKSGDGGITSAGKTRAQRLAQKYLENYTPSEAKQEAETYIRNANNAIERVKADISRATSKKETSRLNSTLKSIQRQIAEAQYMRSLL